MVAKAALGVLVRNFGVKAIIEIGQGNLPKQAGQHKISERDIQNTKKYFSTLLTRDKRNPIDSKDVTVD